MKELVEALAPWPLAQGIVIGLLVAGVGFWAMRRGMQDRSRREAGDAEAQKVRLDIPDEEKRLQWAAYQQLHHLEQNSFKTAASLEQLLDKQERLIEAVERGNSIKWNQTQ